ncbi:DUF4124 domain-containing protein [Xanthomonas phaseoli pv. phaseoli]|nr:MULTISPECIES: DUF4124 domain-containing protein [Xanthomonas]MDM4801170.1 DUF4124 domain-containing protein [Xanthomonas phaseoli pv. phaseoli]MDM4805033.1 DUF4124 domain-containing protein [Xanthomonas phaseoli pv. phaseoli]MDM4809176.1 DUF4124 domain-containing protein [Xanthomonas phaseoli pv. phaseoli]UNW13090.1 DUF4124 domain-containing protein [Xanthomonas phaseoli pv. phaseoli]UZB14508.1 DUF4124 domain-containing protein [Xanthomonas phaseoli pv. phaseoli]
MLALPAAAQSAYKCSDAKLGTVYQSTPCADGAEQKRWTKQAAPASTATATAAQAGTQAASGKSQESNLGLRLISYERQPSPEACTRATMCATAHAPILRCVAIRISCRLSSERSCRPAARQGVPS